MPKFIITLTGCRSFEFTTEVEAETEMDALEIADSRYDNADSDDDRFNWGDWELDDSWEAEEEETDEEEV